MSPLLGQSIQIVNQISKLILIDFHMDLLGNFLFVDNLVHMVIVTVELQKQSCCDVDIFFCIFALFHNIIELLLALVEFKQTGILF